jgi:hypothetical protein
MKLAWLCYRWKLDDTDTLLDAIILFKEPERYEYERVVPIVYAEIVE